MMVEHLLMLIEYCDILPQLKSSSGLSDDVGGLLQSLARLLLTLRSNHLIHVLTSTVPPFLSFTSISWNAFLISPLLELLLRPQLRLPSLFAIHEAVARLSPESRRRRWGEKEKKSPVRKRNNGEKGEEEPGEKERQWGEKEKASQCEKKACYSHTSTLSTLIPQGSVASSSCWRII